ncbi:radical SAM protein, partial [Rubrivivax gelatinosus]
MLHPEPRVDALWQTGLDAKSPLICSAGRTGFYIDAVGNYWKCGAIASKYAPIGNILRDGELKFAASPVCERFPTQQANPGAEIQCWCVENQVLDVTKSSPAQLEGLYDRAFFHIDVSRLCNYSCHYCTVSKDIFDSRQMAKKREHLSDWAKKPYMDRADLELIAREIFAKCRNVQIRIAGMMEPLMNPDILALFEVCRANLDKVREIRLMSNLGIERTFEDILEMGFGRKLHTIVSMHVVDDNFDPFRVVRQIKRAERAGTIIGSHIVPSPIVRELMMDYLDFFSLHGVRVRPVPYIVDDPSGRPLEKGTQQPGHVPRHYRAMKDFLGENFAGRVAGKSYAAYVEQIRAFNADSYGVLEAFGAEGSEQKRTIYMLKADAAPPSAPAAP